MGSTLSRATLNYTSGSGHHLDLDDEIYYEEVWHRTRGPSVSPDGYTAPQLPNHYLLSSAVEIVTRQRVAEQLESLLLNSDSNRGNPDAFYDSNLATTHNQERFFHPLSPSHAQYSNHRHSTSNTHTSLLSPVLTSESSGCDFEDSNNSRLQFPSLNELFAFLLRNDEIRLKENLQSIVSPTLNTIMDEESDGDFDFDVKLESTREEAPPIACPLQLAGSGEKLSGLESCKLIACQQSFENLLSDVRARSFWGGFCDDCRGRAVDDSVENAREIAPKPLRNKRTKMSEDLPTSARGFGSGFNSLRSRICASARASTSKLPHSSAADDRYKINLDAHRPNLVDLVRARECGALVSNWRPRRCGRAPLQMPPHLTTGAPTKKACAIMEKLAPILRERRQCLLRTTTAVKTPQASSSEATHSDGEGSSAFLNLTARGHRRAQLGGFTASQRAMIDDEFLPNQRRIVDTVRTKNFCVAYLSEGNDFVTASQDHRIRLYSAQGPRQRYVLKQTLQVPFMGWSILDVALSPDGRHLVYSTWNESIQQCNIRQFDGWQQFRMDVHDPSRYAFFSLRFNADGTEIVAGANDHKIYVYNREAGKCVLAVEAHQDDVNAVCFGDASSHLILSGADDGLCKVWDRRTMGDCFGGKPVGEFAGHRDGISFIDSRGDDRYLLTNCKDQTVKVWDLRVFACEKAIKTTKAEVGKQDWDYRYQMPDMPIKPLYGDCSVATLRGHSVLHTLIRARFSPDHTGKRYIYTGCARGNCFVYDFLTGEIVKVYSGHAGVVRDCMWHPYRNEIITTSWDGRTNLWRFDQRSSHTLRQKLISKSKKHWHNSDIIDKTNFSALEEDSDEESCDENYQPIRRRRVNPEQIRRLRRGTKNSKSDG